MREFLEEIIWRLRNEIRQELRAESIATRFVNGFAMILIAFLSYKWGVCDLACLTTRDWWVIGTLYVGLIVAKWFQFRFY